VPIDHTITAHPAGKSLTLADLRAFLDNAARFGAALNAQVDLKVGFAGNVCEMSITVPDPSARPATQQQQATTQPAQRPSPTPTAPLPRARPEDTPS
jgi:hypothetical protein